MKSDYYKTLGLKAPSSKKDIKNAYKRLVRQYHPDVSQKDTSLLFTQIVEAYNVLSDPNQKAVYDAFYLSGLLSNQEPPICSECNGSSVKESRCYLCEGVGFYFKKIKYGKYDVDSKIICTLCMGKGIIKTVCYKCK